MCLTCGWTPVGGSARATDGFRLVSATLTVAVPAAGQVFRMDMYHPGHPDGDYQTANKVHALDPPHAIGWLTGYDPEGDDHLEFGGWFWRYDRAPLGPSETAVTLTYDWSAVPQSIREYIQFPPFGPEHLTNSLHHLAEIAAPTSDMPGLCSSAYPI